MRRRAERLSSRPCAAWSNSCSIVRPCTIASRSASSLRSLSITASGLRHCAGRRGRWALVEKVAQRLTGVVVVRLHKGTAVTTQRRSPNSLYSESFATFDKDEVYNQAHAEGFIRLFSLPARIAALTAANPGAGAKPARKEKVRT